MTLPWPVWPALWLLVVNLWTWSAFAMDKQAAIDGARRTPEKDLLLLALIGGTPAAFAAQQVLRHKTRKEPFRTLLLATACGQLILLPLAIAWLMDRL